MPSVKTPSRRLAARATTPMVIWLGLALVILLADQISKTLILGRFDLGDSVKIYDFFNLVRVHNAGAAFSFLAGASGWQRWFFVGLGTVAAGFIIWMLRRYPSQRLFCASVSLILGGALGNVIDRLLHGHVIDFLQFHWAWLAPMFPGGYFPSFNIADAAITLGAIGLITDELRRVKGSP